LIGVVAARAAPAEHRIGLARLELPPADQLGVLVGLEVAHAHDHRARVLRGGDARDALREPLDEIGLLVAPASR
jgi:hypothetical protein